MNKLPSRAGVGASSILFILVMLCLTVFGVLALMTARVDRNMTEKTVAASETYYAADMRAQTLLAQIDGARLLGKAPDEAFEQVVAAADGSYFFTVAAGDGLLLEVRFTSDSETLTLLSYRLIHTDEWENGKTGENYWQ